MNFVVILEHDKAEDCWVTFVPALDDISTWGKTRQEALKNTKEAIIGYLEALKVEGLPLPPSKSVEITEVRVAV